MQATSILSVLLLVSITTVRSFSIPSPPASSTLRLFSTEVATRLEGRPVSPETTLHPLHSFVLVQVDDTDASMTVGGIVLPGKKKKKTYGTVVATGPGQLIEGGTGRIPISLAPGDGVMYGEYDGTAVEWKDDQFVLIREEDVLIKYSKNKISLDTVETIRDAVLVRVDPVEAQSKGGILLPGNEKVKKASTGTVVKVGPGRMASNGVLMEMEVVPGDAIQFYDFAGQTVELADDKEHTYTVVSMSDILAKF